MTIYLIHFDRPYRHARHYLGFTRLPLARRIAAHREEPTATSRPARLMQVVNAAGIGWRVVRTWVGGQEYERRLKKRTGVQHCPVCRAAKRAAKEVA